MMMTWVERIRIFLDMSDPVLHNFSTTAIYYTRVAITAECRS
jgi:hypothetical protein